MADRPESATDPTFRPLTPERWPDLETLFGPRGASGGCWCMWWRLPRAEYDARKGDANKDAFRAIVEAGPPPGLLAYAGSRPIAWCAIAPRETFPVLARSRTLKPIDDAPVWSVVCLFVVKPYRRQGVTPRLLAAAVAHATQHGARIVEGYPVEPRSGVTPDAFAWTGTVSAFRRAAFVEVLRRSPTRPIMRLVVQTT